MFSFQGTNIFTPNEITSLLPLPPPLPQKFETSLQSHRIWINVGKCIKQAFHCETSKRDRLLDIDLFTRVQMDHCNWFNMNFNASK